MAAPPPVPAKPAVPLIAPPGVAATVDGTNITVAQVEKEAYDMSGVQALDQLIQYYLIDEEAKKDGVTVTKDDLQSKIDDITNQLKPQTLDQALKQRNMTMDKLNAVLTRRIELEKIASKDIQPIQMMHVHHILIKVAAAGTNLTASSATGPHADADALILIKKIQADIAGGKTFDDEAKLYSEDTATKPSGGDITTPVYTGSSYDANFIKAALTLKKGQITPTPVKTVFGYHLIECISTSDDHPASEDKYYADAQKQYMQMQSGQKANMLMQSLHAKAKITNYLTQTQQ
jgi:parvulin-like peptidyl-prolyl isomerase